MYTYILAKLTEKYVLPMEYVGKTYMVCPRYIYSLSWELLSKSF